MKIKIFFILLALAVTTSQLHAQSSKSSKKESKQQKDKLKKEEKQWKKRAKRYLKSPLSLKQLVEAKQKADEQASNALSELEELRSTVEKKDAQIAEFKDGSSQVDTELTALREQVKKMRQAPTSKGTMDYSKGVVFKVQIGSFKERDLTKYFKNNPNFAGEVMESGAQRVVVGVFRDYWEADVFKKQLREMGVRDAWIVPFRDGKRVDIKDVVEGISSN